MRYIVTALLWLTCLGLLPSKALGAPAKGGRTEADRLAREHFNRAEVHYRQREFQKALVSYKRSLEQRRHPALLFNIAQCYRQMREWEPALFYYRLYLSESPRAPNRDEVRGLIQRMEAKVAAEKRSRSVGRLSVITRPPGAEVRLDAFGGKALGVTPVILTVAVGRHLLQVRQAGRKTLYRTVEVKPDDITLVELILQIGQDERPVTPPPERRVVTPPPERRVVTPPPERRVVTPPPPPGKAPRSPFYKTRWFWGAAGGSVALMVMGAGFGSWALDLEQQYENATTDSRRKTLASRGRAVSGFADFALFTGLIGAAGVTVTALLWERFRKREGLQALRILPSCGTQGCAVTLTHRF